MKNIMFWLLEKSKIQTLTIITVIIVTLVSRYLIEDSIRKTQDYYTPTIYIFLILWVYYSLFCKVTMNNSNNEKHIEVRNFDKPKDHNGKFIKLFFLIFIGYKSFYIFEVYGALFMLTVITLTGLFSVIMIVENMWSNKPDEDNIIQIIVFVGIIGYIYFIPWKDTYSYTFGVKEIGSYFEKHSYKARYLVEISKVESEVAEKLPAELLISDDFSEFESYDSETGVGAYSYETTKTSKIKYAKINKVYRKNGTSLDFDNCLISINNSDGNTCVDSSGNEWLIRITNEKVK